jgi:glycosyltransferase involved in cell wall biosynthesis
LSELNLCVNTQTPLVQYSSEWASRAESAPDQGPFVDMASLVVEMDYRFTPGGVTRMVFPLLKEMMEAKTLRAASWVSLNSNAPAKAVMSGIELYNVLMDAKSLKGYGKTKEAIWGTVHGLDTSYSSGDMFWRDDFTDYAYYNRLSAEAIQALDKEKDFDVFYIHDFQQLPIGQMLGTLKPKVFRWHIPFDREAIPKLWEGPLSAYLNSYDVVIASSKRYLQSLKEFGFTGKARHVYPYVDPSEYTRPPKREVLALGRRFGIGEGSPVALAVARMDPIKGQDTAIRAMAKAKKKCPELRLLLVGNGSFSSSKGGLGLSKGEAWRAYLEELAKKLGVANTVTFAGHLSQRELDAAYEMCSFAVLPSVREGFGLVVIEAWIHRKTALVSRGAGASELVAEGSNGYLFDCGDAETLSEQMCRLSADATLARKLGAKGHLDSRRCYVQEGVREESAIISGLT